MNPLCTTNDEAGNPGQNIITKAKRMTESVDKDVMIHSVKKLQINLAD